VNRCTVSTVEAHHKRLGMFVDWLEEQGIDNVNDLTGRKIHRYRTFRRQDADLAPATEKSEMDTVRVFIRWCESIDAVEQDLSTKVQSPAITAEENTRDIKLDPEDAETALNYLGKYHYASVYHVTLTLLWRSMMRRGAVRALDIQDYNPEERFIEIRHRPETGTPLKNKSDGERCVSLAESVCETVDDYIETHRRENTDEYGRDPLLTTRHGRAAKTTITKYCYNWTRPCAFGKGCPHGRDVDDCEATQDYCGSSKCPSSVSPHAFRRGSITHHLSNDVPENVVSDRANVGNEVLEQHYDRRTEQEKMEQRRGYLDNI
jgi:integrase